jgi:hypothetical protein
MKIHKQTFIFGKGGNLRERSRKSAHHSPRRIEQLLHYPEARRALKVIIRVKFEFEVSAVL